MQRTLGLRAAAPLNACKPCVWLTSSLPSVSLVLIMSVPRNAAMMKIGQLHSDKGCRNDLPDT